MNRKKNTTGKKKRQDEYKNAAKYVVYLLRCALNQIDIKDFPINCTWDEIWKLVEWNQIEALIGIYIQGYREVIPEEIRKTGKRVYNETLYRQLCFDVEREKIIKNLEEQKLAHLMLKGVNISKYYPITGTRWMSDNDILCGFIQRDEREGYRRKGTAEEEIQYWEKKTHDAIQIAMEKSGFVLSQSGICHDSYIKQPMFKFEMHHQLFQKSFDEVANRYYENPWKYALSDEQSPYLYHYSKEDEYIFFITHAYKHFSVSGSGIRTLVDVYVYIKNNMSMDWDYISSQMKILELEKFEKLLRNTALHVFSLQGKMTTDEWNTVFYMIGSGTFGTSHNRIKHYLEKVGTDKKNSKNKKWCYIKNRLWLDENTINEHYPFFYRHRWLRLFMPLYRVIKGLLIHPKKIWTEWRILFRIVRTDK
mgnify:CR=1 FL=1